MLVKISRSKEFNNHRNINNQINSAVFNIIDEINLNVTVAVSIKNKYFLFGDPIYSKLYLMVNRRK